MHLVRRKRRTKQNTGQFPQFPFPSRKLSMRTFVKTWSKWSSSWILGGLNGPTRGDFPGNVRWSFESGQPNKNKLVAPKRWKKTHTQLTCLFLVDKTCSCFSMFFQHKFWLSEMDWTHGMLSPHISTFPKNIQKHMENTWTFQEGSAKWCSYRVSMNHPLGWLIGTPIWKALRSVSISYLKFKLT